MTKNNSLIFALFSCCFVVEGATRSIIYDSQRMTYIFIPNALAHILKTENDYDLILKKYNEHSTTIEDYFKVLEEHEFILYSENIEKFPKISKIFETPFLISNSVIEISDVNSPVLTKTIIQLNQIMCPHLFLIFTKESKLDEIHTVLKMIETTNVKSVEISIKYNEGLNDSSLSNTMNRFPVLVRAEVDSAPYNSTLIIERSVKQQAEITFTKQRISSNLYCGNINSSSFSLNFRSFLEMQSHNGCLNQKISIDTEGNIKNCPSMIETFGNILDTTLIEAIEKPGFNKYWDINKDKILVCSDCEFRYMCTDCRAYVEDPEDIHSKPLKCGYNPYTGEWNEWSTNPLKQKAIDFYGMKEMLKDF